MNKQTKYIIIGLIVAAAIAVGVWFYLKKKKQTGSSQKVANLESIPSGKPYDGELKRLVNDFFAKSKLGEEQKAALLESAVQNLPKNSNSKVDSFVATVSHWVPAWQADEKITDKKAVEEAWAWLFKEWSALKSNAMLN